MTLLAGAGVSPTQSLGEYSIDLDENAWGSAIPRLSRPRRGGADQFAAAHLTNQHLVLVQQIIQRSHPLSVAR